jgi:hypothetical protein
MLEWFKLGFGISLGVMGGVLSVVLIVGLVDTLTGAVKMARMRQKILMRLKD